MNKKEILNELLQENPEISKEKMEEILEILLENNPKVEIDKNFRKNLKTRLLNIWNYERKNFFQKYFKVFIPAFSAIWFFVIFWLFYFNSLNNSKNFSEINPTKSIKFQNENFLEEKFENPEVLKTSLDINEDNFQDSDINFQLQKTRKIQKFDVENFSNPISLIELEKIIKENQEMKKNESSDYKEISWVIFKFGEITWWVDFLESEMEKLNSKEIVKNISEKINSMLKAQMEIWNEKTDFEIIWIKYLNL